MTEMKTQDVLPSKEGLGIETFGSDLVQHLEEAGYLIVETDLERPWGGFLRISDDQAGRFLTEYFDGVTLPSITEGATLSPKFLIVEPGKNLSWQVHKRRAEFWRVVKGPVGVYRSKSDEQPENPEIFNDGETIDLPVGTRHRLAGLDKRGVVTEIWIHTDPKNLSDEADIERIMDDFGR